LPADGRLDVSQQVSHRLSPAIYIPADEFLNGRAIYHSISVGKWIATDLGCTGILRPFILGSFKYYEREYKSSQHQFLSFSLLFCYGLLVHAKSSTIFLPPTVFYPAESQRYSTIEKKLKY
jgi:hypothetical protein